MYWHNAIPHHMDSGAHLQCTWHIWWCKGVPHSSRTSFIFLLSSIFICNPSDCIEGHSKHEFKGKFETIPLISMIYFVCRSANTSTLQEWSHILQIQFFLRFFLLIVLWLEDVVDDIGVIKYYKSISTHICSVLHCILRLPRPRPLSTTWCSLNLSWDFNN